MALRMHLKPIVIPLRAGGMPEIVDDCEYGGQTSRGIRRSSEVLGMGAALTWRGVIIFTAVAFILFGTPQSPVES